MIKLVLLRHGQSTWNLENRFTGWTDVPLTERGVGEGKKAGELLKNEGYSFDVVFTSYLKRALLTTHYVLDEMNLLWIPVHKHWRLNERHYGALQGLNKAEMTAKHGEEQVKLWRRSFDIPPPILTPDDIRYPGNDPKYAEVAKQLLPLRESLKDTVARVLPYWKDEIVPLLKKGKKVLVSASGNSLRALVMHLDNVSKDAITELNIPTGVPLVYELDDKLKPIKHYFLGDQEAIQKQIAEVANQAQAKKKR